MAATIRETFAALGLAPGGPNEAIIEALIQREESIADAIRLESMQFGLFPGIVTGTIYKVGLGRPPATQEEANFIVAQYNASVEELLRQIREANPGDEPENGAGS